MITFRTSSTLQNLTERPLRFTFNDKRKCLALIDSYSTRILIIDYMDFSELLQSYTFNRSIQTRNFCVGVY